jgi:putative tryptophan/tyrosine transport system substrate-binding protein
MSTSALLSKCLQFLGELVPKDATIGVLVNPSVSNTIEDKENIQAAARQLGRQIFIVTAGKEAEIDTVFATLAERQAGGLVVQGDLLYTNHRDDFIALAAGYAMPTVYICGASSPQLAA